MTLHAAYVVEPMIRVYKRAVHNYQTLITRMQAFTLFRTFITRMWAITSCMHVGSSLLGLDQHGVAFASVLDDAERAFSEPGATSYDTTMHAGQSFSLEGDLLRLLSDGVVGCDSAVVQSVAPPNGASASQAATSQKVSRAAARQQLVLLLVLQVVANDVLRVVGVVAAEDGQALAVRAEDDGVGVVVAADDQRDEVLDLVVLVVAGGVGEPEQAGLALALARRRDHDYVSLALRHAEVDRRTQ